MSKPKKRARIESLTAEQVAMLAVYRDRWIEIGLSCEPAEYVDHGAGRERMCDLAASAIRSLQSELADARRALEMTCWVCGGTRKAIPGDVEHLAGCALALLISVGLRAEAERDAARADADRMREQVEFVREVLSLGDGFNELGDLWESISWRTDGEYAPWSFSVNCNDVFYWACADCEDLTRENLPLLKQSVLDVRAAVGVPAGRLHGDDVSKHFDDWYSAGHRGATLFCARVRKMRPQRPMYKHLPEALHPLFDACGPVRDPKDEG